MPAWCNHLFASLFSHCLRSSVSWADNWTKFLFLWLPDASAKYLSPSRVLSMHDSTGLMVSVSPKHPQQSAKNFGRGIDKWKSISWIIYFTICMEFLAKYMHILVLLQSFDIKLKVSLRMCLLVLREREPVLRSSIIDHIETQKHCPLLSPPCILDDRLACWSFFSLPAFLPRAFLSLPPPSSNHRPLRLVPDSFP